MKSQDEYYIDICYKLAQTAYKKNEVPVGCCIVRNNKIISKSYNRREKSKNSLHHAEIIAINKACKKLKEKFLEDCCIYITLEPCLMCLGAILQARIKRICYSLNEPKFGCIESLGNILNDYKFNHLVEVTKGIKENEVKLLMQNFFKNLRKN